MIDDAALAERFYGSTTPSTPTAPVVVDPTAEVASRFYDNPTSHPNRAATPKPPEPAGAPIATADAKVPDAAQAAQQPAQAAEHGFAPTAEDGRAYDGETLAAYAGVVREAGIDHNVAQQVWTKMAGALAARQEAAVVQQAERWAEAARSDPEIAGSDGSELQSNLRAANALIRRYGDSELGTLLRETGLGSHPAIVRFVTRLARDRGW